MMPDNRMGKNRKRMRRGTRQGVGTRVDVEWMGGPLWVSFSPHARIVPCDRVEECRYTGTRTPTRVPTLPPVHPRPYGDHSRIRSAKFIRDVITKGKQHGDHDTGA